ncbi:MAG: 3-hydroxyacyl-CoA dehydrogenase family protein, partial [Terriglobia bacterium]
MLDLVGVDVFANVVRNLRQALPDDERKDIFRLPEFILRMIDLNLLGEKTRQGFYRKAGPKTGSHGESEILTLELSSLAPSPTLEYRARQKPQLPGLDIAKSVEDLRSRIRLLIDAPERTGKFYQHLFSHTFHYAAMRIPEISDDIVSIDNAVKWGFNWECGPFELWDAAGVERVLDLWKERQLAVPPLVEKLLSSGSQSFYRDGAGELQYFDLKRGDYLAVPERPGTLLLASLKARGREVKKNAGASLIDLGDGVLCLEFHSKMNAIGPDSIEMVHAGCRALGDHFDALVIGNQSGNFSVGANLLLLALAIQEGDWDEVHQAVRAFQNANMALKYA